MRCLRLGHKQRILLFSLFFDGRREIKRGRRLATTLPGRGFEPFYSLIWNWAPTKGSGMYAGTMKIAPTGRDKVILIGESTQHLHFSGAVGTIIGLQADPPCPGTPSGRSAAAA